MSSVEILIATAQGLWTPGGPAGLDGENVTALSERWAVTSGRTVWHFGRSWERHGELSGMEATCVCDGFIGTSGAHVVRAGHDRLEPLPSFDAVPSRKDWYTPWGGPPDTRALCRDGHGNVYAAVHVGGVLRSADDGVSWTQTSFAIHDDVHDLRTHDGLLLAPAATGLFTSSDAGRSWDFDEDGLDVGYLRSVAVAGDWVIVGAADGPHASKAALYRRPLGGGRFAKCSGLLPRWFDDHIDTGCLDAAGEVVAAVEPSGCLWVSGDAGANWEQAARDLPRPAAVVVRTV